MSGLEFLDYEPDFASPRLLAAYDELPLWSAMFGVMLLERLSLDGVTRALDVGCGTGFPLIELAERLGPRAHVDGIDPWEGGLARAAEKIAARGTRNVTLHEGSAASLPFADATFDLIVSNLGINNFDDRVGAIKECKRVLKRDGRLALTTNVQGHMQEFYDAFEQVLTSDEERTRLREHVQHRGDPGTVMALLDTAKFRITRFEQQEQHMRFANGEALFNHHFIKLGFLDAWKKIVPGREREVFSRLIETLDHELTLTIPMLYLEALA